MTYRQDVFATQYVLVDEFVRHLVYYRAIHSRMVEVNLRSAFWAACANSNLFQAAIKWCAVFGSDGCNETHWKHLRGSDNLSLQTSFRDGLFALPDMSESEWSRYWTEMTHFRNNYAAHRSLKYTMPVPSFDLALEVAFYYDRWVRRVIHPDSLSAPPLRTVASRVRREAKHEIEKAIPK